MAEQQLQPQPEVPPLTTEDPPLSNGVANAVHEFSLAIKPKGLPLFKISALYKSRLKVCIFLHFVLFLVMMAKLSEDILDRMDIFILEIEELFIPKPLPFEYLWASSICFGLAALRALSHNRLGALQSYAAGTITTGVTPLLGAAVYFYSDVLEYVDKKGEAQIEKWQGFPVALWWYGFIIAALQVHFFSLYFAWKLVKMWRVKMKRSC